MIALDVLLLVMIVICVTYCWILNRRIQDLHNSRVEFARMIKEFDASIVKADKAIEDMGNIGKESHKKIDELQTIVRNSSNISTELDMVTDMATKISERLENQITEARQVIEDTQNIPDYNPNQTEMFAAPIQEKHHRVNINEQFEDSEKNVEFTPKHMDKLGEALQRIVSHNIPDQVNIDQTGYFGSLKKISTRK
jgi:methyl-accepting chemotaxis protein